MSVCFPPRPAFTPGNQFDAKGFEDVLRVLPSILPVFLDAATKSAQPVSAAKPNDKFLEILLPLIPSIIGAVTKGPAPVSQTPVANEKDIADIVNLVSTILPLVVGAASKSAQEPSDGPDDKFLELLPIILPPLIGALTKGFGVSFGGDFSTPFGGFAVGASAGAKGGGVSDADQKFLNILVPVLSAVLPQIVQAVTR